LISKQIDDLSRKQGLYGNSWMLKSVKDFSEPSFDHERELAKLKWMLDGLGELACNQRAF